jgi:hypothetical protein
MQILCRRTWIIVEGFGTLRSRSHAGREKCRLMKPNEGLIYFVGGRGLTDHGKLRLIKEKKFYGEPKPVTTKRPLAKFDHRGRAGRKM